MSRKSDLKFGIAAFVLGGGVMAVEMTAARIMAPYFGTSFFVWTALIVTILVAMSVGYWVGGRLSLKGIGEEALGRLMLAAALVSGVTMLILPSVVVPLKTVLYGGSMMPLLLFVGSLLTSALFFGVPVFLLAMASPLLLKSWGAGEDAGLAAGRYFAVSTVGSVVGTIVPSLVLIPLLGSRITYALVAASFFACSFLFAPRRPKGMVAVTALAVASSALLGAAPLKAGQVYRGESPYQHIEVWEREGWRYLVFDDVAGVQTIFAPDGQLTGAYYDYYGAIPYLRNITSNSRVVVLGLAGGSALRGFLRELPEGTRPETVGVEIDGSVVEVGRRYFGLDDLGVQTFVMDGREFLESEPRLNDVILVDAYSNQMYIPPHLVSREFFRKARGRLAEDGLLVMNVNAPQRQSPLLVTLLNTVSSEFEHVGLVAIPDSWNYLVVASDAPVASELASLEESAPRWLADAFRTYEGIEHAPGKKVFTDDWAPLEMMTDTMFIAEAWR